MKQLSHLNCWKRDEYDEIFSKAPVMSDVESVAPYYRFIISQNSSISAYDSIASSDDFVDGRTSVDLFELTNAMAAKRHATMEQAARYGLSRPEAIVETPPLQYSKLPNTRKSRRGGRRKVCVQTPLETAIEVFEDNGSDSDDFAQILSSPLPDEGKTTIKRSETKVRPNISNRLRGLVKRNTRDPFADSMEEPIYPLNKMERPDSSPIGLAICGHSDLMSFSSSVSLTSF
jgi:hypothetical protein